MLLFLPLLRLDLLPEELGRALIDLRQLRIVHPLHFFFSLQLFLMASLLFDDIFVSLGELKVEEVDAAADAVPLVALSAAQWLQTIAVHLS